MSNVAKNQTASSWQIPAITTLAMLLAFWLAPHFPSLETTLTPYAKYNLSILLLINALHIHYASLHSSLVRSPMLLIYGIIVKNILLPMLAFLFCYFVWPETLVAVILITGISSGFSAVSFAILLRLAPEINLLLTLGSSFVVPFSLPLLLHYFTGASVEIDLLGMMLQTTWMVFVPILLERVLFFALPKQHFWLRKNSQSVLIVNLSITSFILMLSGQAILRREAEAFFSILLFSITLIALTYVFTLLLFFRSTLERQLIMLIGNLVSNTGMTSVLALDYLDQRTLAISIVFSVVWNFNILFLRSWPPLYHAIGRLLGSRDTENML